MKSLSAKRLLAGALTLGATGALGLALTGPAAAVEERGLDATISMERDGNNLYFEGPDTVYPGFNLRIQNNTNPQQVGPHTFTLAKKNLIPSNKAEMKACFKGEKDSVCRSVFKAHEIDFQKQKIGKVSVDDGKEGWNLLFRLQGATGDSWFVEEEGDSQTRTVSAKPGKTLSFFCVIHPEMQGEVQVANPVR